MKLKPIKRPYFIADPHNQIVGEFRTKAQAVKKAKLLAFQNPSERGAYGFLVYRLYYDKATGVLFEDEVQSFHRTKR